MRRPGPKTLDQQAKSGDPAVKRQSTWRMSVDCDRHQNTHRTEQEKRKLPGNSWIGYFLGAGVAAILGLVSTPLLTPFEKSFANFSFPGCYALNGAVSFREWLTVHQAMMVLRQDMNEQAIFDDFESRLGQRSSEWRKANDQLQVTERFRADALARCGAATSLPADVSRTVWFFLELRDREGTAEMFPSIYFESNITASECISDHGSLTNTRLESLRLNVAIRRTRIETVRSEMDLARPIFTYEQRELIRFRRRLTLTENLPSVCWSFYPSDLDAYPL